MESAMEVCRGAGVGGVCSTSEPALLAVTLRKDGVVEFDTRVGTRLRSWTLRNPQWQLQGPLAFSRRLSTLLVAVSSPETSSFVLVIPWRGEGAVEGDFPSVAVPAPVVAMAPLGGARKAMMLVVTSDGTVTLVSEAGQVSAAARVPGCQVVLQAVAVQPSGVAVMSRGAAGAVRVNVFRAVEGGVAHVASEALPAGRGVPLAAAVAAGSGPEAPATLALLYADGAIECRALPGPGPVPAAPRGLPVARELAVPGLAPLCASATPAPSTPAGKKRGRLAEETHPAASGILCSTEEGHLIAIGRVRPGHDQLGTAGSVAAVALDLPHGAVHAVVDVTAALGEAVGAAPVVQAFALRKRVNGPDTTLVLTQSEAVHALPLPLSPPSVATALRLRGGSAPLQQAVAVPASDAPRAAAVAPSHPAWDAPGDVAIGALLEPSNRPAKDIAVDLEGGRELQGSIRDALVQLEAESTAGGAEGRVRDIIGRCRGAGAAIGPSVVARISAKCFQVQAWQAVGILLDAVRPRHLVSFPGALPALAGSGSPALVCTWLRKSLPAPAPDLHLLLESLFGDARRAGRSQGHDGDTGGGAGLSSGLGLLRASGRALRERAVAAAEGLVGDAEREAGAGGRGRARGERGRPPAAVLRAVAAAAAVRGAPWQGLVLSAAMMENAGPGAVLRAVEGLSGKAVAGLAKDLLRLLRAYRDHPLLLSAPEDDIPVLRDPLALPPLSTVVTWAGSLLDAHLPRMMGHDARLRRLGQEIKGVAQELAESAASIAGLAGHTHLLSRRITLPRPRNTTTARHVVEVIPLAGNPVVTA